ncbi:MAG TPA: radical SAM protein [Phycisphaerae bacterium]|nr:radical SAM protein [Phycisphaerae bacterium]
MKTALRLLDQRILSCYAEARELACGRMCHPRMVIVYPTYRCNHDCVGCDYAVESMNRAERPAQMATEHFRSVLNQFTAIGVRAWEACGGGEPTLHPDLTEMIIHGSWLGLRFGLLTNGTRLAGPLVDVLLDHASYCRVSIEAATRETFDRYKRPATAEVGFDAVVRNVRDLIRRRDAARSPLVVSYKFAADVNNWRDVAAAFPLAQELGVDSLQFKAIRNVPSEMDAHTTASATALLHQARQDYPDLSVLGGFDRHVADPADASQCWLSPLAPTVDPRGDVYLCCYYRHRVESHRLGNLFDTPLAEFWGSDEHWRRIQAINPAECVRYDCRFLRYNPAMSEAMTAGQLEFI